VFYKNYLKHNKPYPALNCEREKIVVPEEPEIESPAWRKSQHSTASGECVEITAGKGGSVFATPRIRVVAFSFMLLKAGTFYQSSQKG
jgi:hypothetical protein